MYSFPNLESVYCSMSSSNCCCFICIQDSQKAGKVLWYSHTTSHTISSLRISQFVIIHIVQGFSIVNEAEVYLEFLCFFCDPANVGNFSSDFCLSSVNILKFTVHILLKPSVKDFEHYLASM